MQTVLSAIVTAALSDRVVHLHPCVEVCAPIVPNAFALLRLLPTSDRYKDVEILVLRHQITILERQLAKTRP